MNKLIYILTLISISIISCEKEPTDKQSTKSTEKIETTLAQSGLTMADKHQTVASIYEIIELQNKIKELRNSFSKNTTKASLVGVIRHGTCAAYDQLIVRMDCEDNNNASWINTTNWNGDIYVDPNSGNITMYFCMVPNYFERINSGDFAVLALNLNPPFLRNLVERHFDNEDDNNINYTTLNGNQISNYGANVFNDNTDLIFYHFPVDPETPDKEFPFWAVLKEGYSLFGSIGNYPQAEIQIDDEDDKCDSYWIISGDDPYTYIPFSYNSANDPWSATPLANGHVFNFSLPSLSQMKVFKPM